MTPTEAAAAALVSGNVSAPSGADGRALAVAIRRASTRVAAAAAVLMICLAFLVLTQPAPLWLRIAAGSVVGSAFASSTILRTALVSPLRIRVETLVAWAVVAAFAGSLALLLLWFAPNASGGFATVLEIALAAMAVALPLVAAAAASQAEVRVLVIGGHEFQARLASEASSRRRRVVGTLLQSDLVEQGFDARLPHFDEIAVEAAAFSRFKELSVVVRGFTGPVLVEDPSYSARRRSLFDPTLPALGRLIKRLMDLVLAIALLASFVPFLVVATVLIKAESRGPVIYRTRRVGEDGRPFTMYKLRTMSAENDDSQHRAYVANYIRGDAIQHSGMFKLHADPRITRIGGNLRRLSIDEIPQLLNVIRGEMSLVGPRPPLAHEVDEYDSSAYQRLRAKPGLTGLWQVRGRCLLSFADQVALDHEYWTGWSLLGDIRILMQTPRAVLSRRGAR